MTIIAKFRRVARYGVAASLAAASCFSAFAANIDLSDCTWTYTTKNGVSGWNVSCPNGGFWVDFQGEAFVPDEGQAGGSCTNCTKMSPAECQRIKDQIIGECAFLTQQIPQIETAVGNAVSEMMDSLTEVRRLKQQGDSFATFGVKADSNNQQSIRNGVSSSSQAPYVSDSPTYSTGIQKAIQAQGGANSIYNYYNQAVAPVLNDLDTMLSAESAALNDAGNILHDLSSSASLISSTADEMVCTACEGSGGGGGGSSPSTPSSGCPCEAAINALKVAVDNCHEKLTDIKTRLDGWDQKIKNINDFLSSIKGDVESIRQTTDRMDDFFRDDTEVNFKKLIEHVLQLTNSVFNAVLKLPPNLYWTEYTNATQFLDDSGSSITWLQKGKDIEAGAYGMVIDFGEYGNLNWFQRMEFLLGHIAGIFSPTNSTNADFNDEQNEKVEDAQDAFDTLTFEDEKTVLNQMVSYVEQAEDSLNPFHGIFDYSSGSTRSITFLPDVSVENDLLGNTMPMITMDLTDAGDGQFSISDLVDLAHNLTTFLWLVSFVVIDILAIIKFVQCLIALNRWYWKIYNSWVATMFNGAGR